MMEVGQLMSASRMNFTLQAKSKEAVIDELVNMVHADGKLLDKEQFKQAVLKREAEFSTGIGMGIAIPHGKDSSVKEPTITFGISKEGIDYESMDDTLAHLFFLIAVPNNSDDTHLKILSYISRKLMHEEVRAKLMSAQSYEDVVAAF